MWPQSATVRHFYLAHLSRPAANRQIYQLIKRHRLRRLVEIGIGHTERGQRMIEVAASAAGADNVVYTGVDLFELRGPQDGEGLTLKLAHRQLVTSGAKIRLLPGDAYSALSRSVNMLGSADLIVIADEQNNPALAQAWFFIERLLHEHSHVLLQQVSAKRGEGVFQPLALENVRRLAVPPVRRRAA